MNIYKEIEGNLIQSALLGEFDVIAHGCNCFCKQKSGIAKEMVKHFKTDDASSYDLEASHQRGNINKLGQIQDSTREYQYGSSKFDLTVINCYSQYRYGTNHPDGQYNPLDYEALQLCLRKINHVFKGKKIGLPMIGCGLAGGKWSIVSKLIRAELADCDVTIVKLK